MPVQVYFPPFLAAPIACIVPLTGFFPAIFNGWPAPPLTVPLSLLTPALAGLGIEICPRPFNQSLLIFPPTFLRV